MSFVGDAIPRAVDRPQASVPAPERNRRGLGSGRHSSALTPSSTGGQLETLQVLTLPATTNRVCVGHAAAGGPVKRAEYSTSAASAIGGRRPGTGGARRPNSPVPPGVSALGSRFKPHVLSRTRARSARGDLDFAYGNARSA